MEVEVQTTKRLVVLTIVCLVIAILTGCSQQQEAAKAPYKIGVVLDITGPASPLGTPEKETVEMLAKQITEAGGINGHPVEFVVLDNGSEETKCVMAVKKLIESHQVKAIIGPSTTGTTLAIAGMCEKAKIPLISCAAGIKITEPAKPYVFKTAQPDTLAAAKVIDYLKAQNITKIAVISDSNAFGASGLEQLQKQAPGAGITIVANDVFGSKDTDVTAQLTRISAKKPGAVVCWGTNPGPAIVAKNMKQLGIKAPLVMSHGIANKKFIELAGDAANGVVFPAGRLIVADAIADSDPQKKTLLEYAEQFQSTYKRSADTFGGHAWDAVQIVVKAMEKAGDDPAKIRDEIEKTQGFVGISGVFNFSPTDHNGLDKNAFVMVKIDGGKWTLLK